MEDGLPTLGAALIGRETEVARLLALLDDASIVTITGVGGVGKTRLASEVASRWANGGRRVCFVELADTERAADVMTVIAEGVGVGASTLGAALDDVVVRRLSETATLLVLDNMEQLVAAAGAVAALAERVPTLRILVTSRIRLRARGERTVALRGLSLPSTRRAPASAASVQLFIGRLGADEPEARDLVDASAICGALAGVPLAIELAAAHARTLGTSTVRTLIESDATLLLLDRGPSEGPARQRSLRGSLEWSYRLLAPAAQRAFRVVGTFSGSFDLDAYRAVAGSDSNGASTLAAFTSLVEHQLVAPLGTARADAPARFTTSPPIRELARERLHDDPELVALTARHRDWYASVAARVATLAQQGGMTEAIAICRADQANLMAALQHSLDAREHADAARVSCDLSWVWEEQGRYAFAREWFDTLAAAATADGVDDPPPELSMNCAYFAMVEGASTAIAEHRSRLEAAVARARTARDDRALLRGLAFLVLSYTKHGDADASRLAADEGRVLADRAGTRAAAAQFTMWLAMLAHQSRDVVAAQALGLDALERARAVGDDRLIVRTSLLLRSLPALDENVQPQVPLLDALLELARADGNALDEMYVTMHLAAQVATSGDVERAFALVHEGLELARRSSARHLELLFLSIVGHCALRVGDDRAAARFHASIAPNADALRASTRPGDMERYERRLAERRAACGAANFDRQTRAAAAQSWDDTILEAMRYAARKARRDTSGGLTPRERDVLVELTKGATNKQIGAALGLTPKTVTHHCAAIYRKLGVRTRAEATAHALHHALV
jgi:predicted ATPase/DNA-binding CsgD family transcriptional regulator